MMPDDRRRTEGDLVAGLLNAPAEIDVVARFAILDVEAADCFESPPIPRHVTAGDVFGDCVSEQDVARTARRGGDARLHPILGGR